MTVSDAVAGRNQVPLAIAYMAGSTAMFAGGNAVVKWQLAAYPLGEVAFGRTLFSFLTVAAIVLPRVGWGVLRTRRYREHLQRGLSQFASMLCWFLAVSLLSLGSATAIGFAAPLFTTLLSIVILKEKVGIHRWSALIVGFVGVLIITHPGTGTLTYGALFALANAVLISTVAIAIRRMSMTESSETLTLYQMSIMNSGRSNRDASSWATSDWREAERVSHLPIAADDDVLLTARQVCKQLGGICIRN
jgi:drug/metabolite transporter (DMT)-like permease